MKNNKLKKITIILLILLISLVSFVGIYTKSLNRMKNIMPDYKVGMDFGEIQEIRLDVDTNYSTKYYDSEGKEVEAPSEETEGITSKIVETNPEEILTSENFAKVKEIITARLSAFGLNEYLFRQDENGYIVIQLPDNEYVKEYKDFLVQAGKLEVKDDETDEVLLDGSLIKEVFATAHTDNEDGSVTALVVLNFNEEGKAKLEEISKTHIKTTDEEGNEVTKSISITLDGQTLSRTYFGPAVTTGQLPISIGTASKDNQTISENYKNAVLIAQTLKSGTLPITYTLTYENVFSSVLRQEVLQAVAILVAVLLVVAVAFLIIRYNKGLFMSLSWLGFISTFFLVLRFTNSVITMNSIIAIIIICAYDYVFLCNLLSKKSNKSFNEILTKYSIIGIPLFIIAIVFSFASVVPISSFGISLFWGTALMVLYNFVITKNLRDES